MTTTITLTPAYGRDYKSAKAAKEDLLSGKDFLINDITHPFCGKYCSVRDLVKEGVDIAYIRYKGNRNLTSVKLRSIKGLNNE